MSVRRISIPDAAALLADGKATVVDIRDALSFQAGHIPGAVHLTNDNVGRFLKETDHARALVVCCYHGNSSISAAAFLAEQGYTEVYSLDGGFEGWRFNHPVERTGPR